MRTLAIGDIHGCLCAFDALLALVQPQHDDVLITLGDYVDRGPDSQGVIERLLELQNVCRLVALKGNHEHMMIGARQDNSEFRLWRACGGAQALDSYDAFADRSELSRKVPENHWRFLESGCVPYHETATHLFVHANLCHDLPMAEQPDYMLYWETLEAATWRPHDSGKTMICGHSIQRSGRPLVLEGAICIDTWVYGEGWLTCLDVEKEAYWQANQKGETRMGMLAFRS